MTDGADPRLSAWQNYYVIVGSSGAALIGIQFVVITLIAYRSKPAQAETVSAFGTPTVVHLAGALNVSAMMTAPWPSLFGVSVALGAVGVGGLLYEAIVIRRARRQTGYVPVWEDWLWHAILPCLLYVALAAGAVMLRGTPRLALFTAAGAALGLLMIGIHNAWDTVTHLVTTGEGEDTTTRQRSSGQGRQG